MTGTAEKEVPASSILNCKKESASTKSTPLTVGDLFLLECSAESFTLNPSQLRLVTNQPYQWHLLGSEMQPDGRLLLKVTSYQVGEINSEGLFLTDGINKMAITGVQAKIESVIDPKNPPEGPYGPFGGIVLVPPLFYLWGIILAFVMVIVFFGFRFYRRWQKKRLIVGLKKHDSRLSPLTQLHVHFRQLERQRQLSYSQGDSLTSDALENQFVELDHILRIFIIRRFKIPAQDWSDRLIINDFQKRFSFLGQELTKDLRVLLREIKKNKEFIQKNFKNEKSARPKEVLRDIERLGKKIKRWADQVDRSLGFLHQSEGLHL